VYFFGGPDGVAQRACEQLAADAGPMRCVGFDAPGFGTVEAMSGSDRLERINASTADFLVVALGAKKGQAWIEHNLDRLRPMVVSHLGAVVNFVAGSVARAPRTVARLGLEWLWRIGQEPALWRRYAGDGLTLAHLTATQVLPLAVAMRRQRGLPAAVQPARITSADRGAVTVLALSGAWCNDALPVLRQALAQRLRDGRTVQLDLAEVTAIDAGFVALALRVDCWQGGPGLIDAQRPVPPGAARTFRLCGAADLLPA
jgi:N-acetylglucosaminyldiphosphoundecaprenol N-acetyl-beta-D-mannosaminyltransferase